MPNFTRQKRYVIFKLTDSGAHLTLDECCLIDRLERKVAAGRLKAGKPPFSAVVVESDWPEYEPTWTAIERRVSSYSDPLPLTLCKLCGCANPPLCWLNSPDEQGLWWWWNQDPDSGPIPVHILLSGTDTRYFASIGQYGWNRVQYVEDMGGFWMMLSEPPLPE